MAKPTCKSHDIHVESLNSRFSTFIPHSNKIVAIKRYGKARIDLTIDANRMEYDKAEHRSQKVHDELP